MNPIVTSARSRSVIGQAHRQAGLTLIESLLVLGLLALILVGVFTASKSANSDVASIDLGRGAVTMATSIKRVNGTIGYSAVAPAAVKDLIPGGWKYDGTDVLDNNGNAVGLSGGAASFAMVFSNLSATDCQKVVSQLEGVSTKLNIGDTGAAAGVVAGGSVYKDATGTITPASLSTGCAVDKRKIAIEVR